MDFVGPVLIAVAAAFFLLLMMGLGDPNGR